MSTPRFWSYTYHTVPGRSGWLSRDPLGEKGGVNLYGFVKNDSINRVDIIGLMMQQDVDNYITIMDQVARRIPCCCDDELNMLVKTTISGKPNGIQVTLKAGIQQIRGKCPIEAVAYFWWDCFTAQAEGGSVGDVLWGNPNAWQDYGWRIGGQTETKSHAGSSGIYSTLFDSQEWNWKAIVVYYYCGNDGHKHAGHMQTDQLEFDWIEDTHSWGNYPHRP